MWRLLKIFYGAVLLATHLLSVPLSAEGCVVECGCFKGRSTATLSLLCSVTGRRLAVFDSFEGLPEVSESDRVHITPTEDRYETYKKGDYTGRPAEVRGNVAKYGCLDQCEFHKGYFEDTLPSFGESVAFAFLDVDLHASLKTCLLHLWPRVREGGMLMTHEAKQLSFASIFFDRVWWREALDCEAPGLIGAGTGLPAGISGSTGLGYAVKGPPQQIESKGGLRAFCGDPTQRGIA